jgi:hypothetical protein
MRLLAVMAAVLVLASPITSHAQRGGGRGGAPAAARESAAIDLTGYWVSVITEDWKYRMVTPKKGVFDALTLNPEARKIGEAWDPAKDEASGEQCKGYGAVGVMRLPTRLNITWQDANTLRIDTDAGTQTRLLQFGRPPAPGEPSWQGHSVAEWEFGGGGRGAARTGNLKVVTTNLRPGYIRKNGAPYSGRTTMTEYFDVNTMPNGDQWMTITTRVEDAQYFTRPHISTLDFKKLPGAAGWNPTPCSAR